MMDKAKKYLAFLTLAFAVMMLVIVILAQYNPTMGFFMGKTFRVYQPIFCVLAALVSGVLFAEHSPQAPEQPAAKPRAPRTPATPRRERKPRQAPVQYDEYDEYGAYEDYGENYADDAPYPDDTENTEYLPEDFDWDEYLK